ncbi:MAG TPA: N-acetylmuramoyl-L-alanine amidase [Lacibacter sp.]|nr:N-acetylmuramoyl-L-alanine amidase [Lacibacter sp.]HMO88635.1 N-acetylmuramoyl-L-alanine amidase [Lacibacter sp.]
MRILKLVVLAGLLVLADGCTRSPYRATNKTYRQQVKNYARLLRQYPLQDTAGIAQFVGTTNFGLRRPNFVVLHHTAQNSCDQTLRTFTLPRTQVSAHYVICKDGTVFHLLHDLLRAHHAGAGRWGSVTDMNSQSIGIELDNNGYEPFDERQLASLLSLLERLKRAYNIPAANFIGHGDWVPTRKNDPNWRFPWKRLSESGFGHWWGDTARVTVPIGFQPLQALRIIGYDVRDSSAAIVAFKRHFMMDTTRGLTPGATKVLYRLHQKYL